MSEDYNWHDVPRASEPAWNAIFHPSRKGLFLSLACPICGAAALRHWYQVGSRFGVSPGFLGRGGLWEWCASCHAYAHYSVLVPDWWSCDLVVDSIKLTPLPTAIEDAIKERDVQVA